MRMETISMSIILAVMLCFSSSGERKRPERDSNDRSGFESCSGLSFTAKIINIGMSLFNKFLVWKEITFYQTLMQKYDHSDYVGNKPRNLFVSRAEIENWYSSQSMVVQSLRKSVSSDCLFSLDQHCNKKPLSS